MRLMKEQTVIVENLEVAESFFARAKGLLGRRELSTGHALWIKRTNSVHTFFMQFPIDLVFLDKNLKVRRTFANVKPGRLVWPVWRALSVVELPAGFLEHTPLKKGDALRCG